MKYTFNRDVEPRIKNKLFKNKVVIIYGPRQVGKTTLSKKIISEYGENGLYMNCELLSDRSTLVEGRPDVFLDAVRGKKIVVLDEAQTIENIGQILKGIIDKEPKIQIVATGSSSFDLANKINEPLTGRSFEFVLYPLSLAEIKDSGIKLGIKDILVYGTYPGVITSDMSDRVDLLQNIASNYLYKDIFNLEQVKKPLVFEMLVKKLAIDVGKSISTQDLAVGLGTNKATVERYISLLERAFIVKRLYSFSRNKSNELKKSFKIYFYDMGICNAIAERVNMSAVEGNIGMIFENFCIIERQKKVSNEGGYASYYFWRTYDKYEVDMIEEREGVITALEFKWSENNFTKSQHKFIEEYEKSKIVLVNKENFREML
jgi:uncharacterized protein